MISARLPTRFINPALMPQPFGYTHVVETHGGRTIYISEQVALDAVGNVVGLGDLQAQTTQVFTNLYAALESVGATFDHVTLIRGLTYLFS